MISLVGSGRLLTPFIIAHDAPPAVRYAAEELLRYIEKMTGAHHGAAIRDDARPAPPHAVLIGDSVARRQLFPDIDPARLSSEASVVQTRHGHLLLIGGSPRGTLYAVYELLERLGVRWWTARDETVPARTSVTVPHLNLRYEPPLIYRSVYYREAFDADWQARQRLNAGVMTVRHMSDRHGGMERFAADAAGHTYALLVPVEKYFDQHPEYFSEINGSRTRHLTQLCCTNPDVADIAAETARGWLDAMPTARLVSATQNDYRNWCTCRDCRALIEREGAPSALVLHLANEIARRLEKSHPDVLVDTFAYDWTLTPPRRMRARPNVLVRLAPIWNCFGHSIRSCPANKPCRDAVRAWAEIAEHLFVWHYVTDFHEYLMPYPNLPSLQDDLRFYLDHGLKGAFYQGNGNSIGGDMSEMKAYLIAKLLWNPQLDFAAARAEFLSGYYRDAAPAMEAYLRVFEKSFAQSGEHMFTYAGHNHSARTYRLLPTLQKARRALDRARRLAADDFVVRDRLELIGARLDYTELAQHHPPQPVRLTARALERPVTPHQAALRAPMFRVLSRRGMTHFQENETTGRLSSLRRRWPERTTRHPVITLRGGGSRLVIVPALGGRIVWFGPERGPNFLAQNSPAATNYPFCIGYEEYSERGYQSPGHTEEFAVRQQTPAAVRLQAVLDNGLMLDRKVSLDQESGAVVVDTVLRNPLGHDVPGDLRAHLEIDLATEPAQMTAWFAGGGKIPLSGEWSGDALATGWSFWSERQQRGFWQCWSRRDVGAVFLGSNPATKTAVSLDLAVSSHNVTIPAGGRQRLRHCFGWTRQPPATSCA